MENNDNEMVDTFNKNKQNDIDGVYLYNVISEIISKKFENKTCSKRIATAIKEELIKTYPNIVVHYEYKYSWYEVQIWGDRFGDYNSSYRLILCYDNEILSKENFSNHNTCYSQGAVERLGICEGLTPTKLKEIITTIINKREELAKMKRELDVLEKSLPYKIDKN